MLACGVLWAPWEVDAGAQIVVLDLEILLSIKVTFFF